MRVAFEQPLALLLLSLVPLVVWAGSRLRLGPRRRWAAAGLRALSVTLLVLALAGTSVLVPRQRLSVVFLLDVSDSMGQAGRTAAADWVRQAYRDAGPGNLSGLVVFGRQPSVEEEVSPVRALGPILSRPDGSATDLPSAMRLALALFPEGAQKRIVVVSDGNNNVGDLEASARLARSADVQVDAHLVGAEHGPDVMVDSLRAPTRVREGESFELQVAVNSTRAGSGTLEVFGDGNLLARQRVSYEAGRNEYTVGIGRQPRGFHAWQARIVADGDSVPQNDTGNAFTYVQSSPRVLIAEGTRGEGRNLESALRATGLEVTRVGADRIPTDLAGLNQYAAVVLVDVPLSDLSDGGRLLWTYVHDLGRGLIVVGGEGAYAMGDYFRSPLESALPVSSDIRNRAKEPSVALVMVIDKSGSMAACHCGDGGSGVLSGPPKVDLVKEATIQSAELLGPNDVFGVLAFDSAARWVVRPAPIGNPERIVPRVEGIHGSGGTNIYAGLSEAIDSLKHSDAKIKHVVLLTDGWSTVTNYDQLIAEARRYGITVSTVSAGGGSPQLLSSIARKGGGTFYVADDPSHIPKILTRETRLALRRYVHEEPFVPTITAPSQVLKGIESSPELLGYVATSPKPAATVALSSPDGDPVLAQWQYGLGRAVAWTSDSGVRWAREWVGTSEYARLWSQATDWAIGSPSSNVQVQVGEENGRARFDVDVLRPDGTYLNGARAVLSVVSPDGSVRHERLTQTAPGHYAGEVPASLPGSYVASVSVTRGTQGMTAPTTGFSVGYSPEYRRLSPDGAAMSSLASTGGGRLLSDPGLAFRHDLPAVYSSTPLWWPLALLALLLLPVEVAVRRLRLSGLAAPTAVTRLRPRPPDARASPTAPEPAEDDRLARLRAAKRRAGRRD